ncbi:MAG: hypothetical protein ACRD3V_34720 [Vicinamibacteria bacterium]
MMKLRVVLFLAGLAMAEPGFPIPILRIHEVFYDAEGSDSAHVFTELSGAPGTSLDGFRLLGIDGGSGLLYRSLDLTGASIPADGLLVIATTRAIGELLSVRDFIADVDWQNGPDAVQLWNPFGAIVDAIQYGDAGSFHLGEGSFAPDTQAGFSLSRDLSSGDTGDNLADFAVLAPTPGTGRAFVPEPVSSMVLFLGLAGVVASGAAPWGRRAEAGARRAPGRSRAS